MNKLTPESREKILTNAAMAIAAVLAVLVAIIVIAQMYVRWSLNQNFTFLGGGELEVLTLSVVALVLGLLHHLRKSKGS